MLPVSRLSIARRVAAVSSAFVTIGLLGGCPDAPTQATTDKVGFTVAITKPVAAVMAGDQRSITVTIVRQPGFTGSVALKGTGNPPSQVTAPDAAIAAGETVATMTVSVDPNAAPGLASLTLVATSPGYQQQIDVATFTVLVPGTFSVGDNGGDVVGNPGTIMHESVKIRRTQYTQTVTMTANVPPFTVAFAPSTTPDNSIDNIIDVAITVPPGLALGNYTIPITGTGADGQTHSVTEFITVRAPTFNLGGTAPSAAILVGSSGVATITAFRDQAFTGAIAITGTAAAGITILPTSIAASATQTTLQISTTGAVVPGQYAVTVTGSSAGITTQVAIQIIVGGYTISGLTPSVNVVAPGSVQNTLTLTRTSFPGAVALAGTSDAGITITASPPSTTANTSTLTVAVTNAATFGPHTVNVTGTAAGLGTVNASFTVVVSAGINTTWSFCSATGLPVWVAVQDGSGAWTAVSGANNAYAFSIGSATGGIAYVTQTGSTDLHIFYGSKAELQARGAALCGNPGAAKTINGTVANTGTAAAAWIGLGSALATIPQPGTTAFQLSQVPSGSLDLLAATVDGVSQQPNALKMILHRSINLSDGGNTGVLDFSAAEAVVAATATLTPNVFDQGVRVTYGFQTTNQVLSTYFTNFTNTGPTLKLFGLPPTSLVGTDVHYISAQAFNGTGVTTSSRIAGAAVATIANMPITFGQPLNQPVPSVLATVPYARLRTATIVQPEYSNLFETTFQQSVGSNRNVYIQMTGGPTGYAPAASTITLDVPDFTAVAGWTNSWGLLAGFTTHWIVTSSSWSGGTGIVFPVLTAGVTFNSATKQGDITP